MLDPKKVACEKCMHKNVCKHEDALRKAQAAVDKAVIYYGDERGEIAISEISCVMPIVLGCKYARYDSNTGIGIRSIE